VELHEEGRGGAEQRVRRHAGRVTFSGWACFRRGSLTRVCVLGLPQSCMYLYFVLPVFVFP
jgi:hypothetical protein